MELNEIESSSEEYPLTRAFCHLISTMVECSLPVNLGAGLRVPGFQPYLDFLRDSVFLPFPTRAYRRPAEKVKEKTWLQAWICALWIVDISSVLFVFDSVGGCWCCSGSLPQTVTGLWAAALWLCPGDGGTTGWAGASLQAPRTQHHVSPAQRLSHAGALS